MNDRGIVGQVASFFVYLLLQVLLMKNVALFGLAFCFIYLSFILLLPFETSRMRLLLTAFALGFCTDVFYDTGGLHAAACVITGFVRPFVLQTIVPSGGYDASMRPWASIMGMRWFITYCLLMITLHGFALFAVEALAFSLLPSAITKAVASAVLTTAVMYLFQLLFYKR